MSQTKAELIKGLNINASAPATALNIDSSGRVGIGTTGPSTELHISRATAGRVITRLADPDGRTTELRSPDNVGNTAGVGTTTNHPFVFFQNNTEAARIDESKRLLVGTSTYAGNGRLVAAGNTGGDAGTLDICWTGSRPTAANTDIGYIRWYSADNSSGNAHYASIYASSDGASSSGSDIPGRLVFSVTADGASSPTERMRIANNGNMMLGGTTQRNSARFTIDANGSHAPFSLYAPTAVTYTNIFFENTNGIVGSIVTAGSSTAYNTSSDHRLKENVTIVTDGITRLQQLKPSRFNFIADPAKTIDGFIAHEVQAVVPEAITGKKDAVDADGNPVYQGIDQSKLVPLLTAALQEAIGKIETLQGMVAVNNMTIDEQQYQISTLADRLTALEAV